MNLVNFLTVITDRARDCRIILARDGVWHGLQCIVKEVLPLPFRHIDYLIMAQVLSEPIVIPQPHLPIAVRIATIADLERFKDIATFSEIKSYSKRFAQGHICHIALHQGRLVGYNWTVTEMDPELEGGISICLQPGDAYLSYSFVAPAYRGQGIAPTLGAHRLRYLQEMGYQRVIALMEVKNHAVLAVARKLGYQEIGRATFQRILWRRTFRYYNGIS